MMTTVEMIRSAIVAQAPRRKMAKCPEGDRHEVIHGLILCCCGKLHTPKKCPNN